MMIIMVSSSVIIALSLRCATDIEPALAGLAPASYFPHLVSYIPAYLFEVPIISISIL